MTIMNNPIVRRIGRPTRSRFGWHVGALLPSGLVAHMTDTAIELVSADEFALGLPVYEFDRADGCRTNAIYERVAASVGQPVDYSLWFNNCEHYVSWLFGEEPRSPQMRGLVAVLAVALMLDAVERE